MMKESNEETAQITSLAEVTPDNSGRFGLPTSTNRGSKNFSISESSSDGTSNEGSNHKVSLADDESLDLEQVTGRDDSRKAARLRIVVIILFITLCVVIPIALYVTIRKSDADGFEASFDRLATKVVDNVELQLARKLSALDSLRVAITSHVLSTNASWPYVTIPDYDLRANSALELGDMLSLSFHPLVSQKNRRAWEEFTMDNLDWLWQAQSQAQTRQIQSTSSQTSNVNYPTKISRISTNNNAIPREIYMLHPSRGPIGDTSQGPYLPTSQIMPPIASAINYNALSKSSSSEASQLVLSGDDKAVLSGIENLYKSYGPETATFISAYYTSLLQDYLSDPEAKYEGDPMSTMNLPIFDEFNRETRQLVGMLSTSISFKYFFTNLLGAISNGILCVIQNGCGDVVSFEIHGDDAIFLGRSDMHDPSFDYMEHSYNFSSVRESKIFSYREKTAQLNDDYCPYSMRVYPTSELQAEYMSSRPVIYAVTIAVAILFMAITSLSYDYIVQRRMRKVLKSAKESRAIVNSLFPTNVRQRLLKEEEERTQQRSIDQRSADGSTPSNPGVRLFPRRLSMDTRSVASTINTRRNSNEAGITDILQQPINTAVNIGVGAVTSMAALPAKLRLKFFLNESRHGQEANYRIESKSAEDNDEEFEKPIADLFPNCTVLFADIAGFTAWSSEREPAQVFTLLQTIFKTFDTMARRRDIFKVETIGDCYVAVTGLPDPQPDHAIRMTRFARTCMQKVSQITAQLESKLGPGTKQLRMRFGLHSGPVTAGVLRGEKSRFQLFGDTVNTASRMESTGMKNRIQLSPSTAQLLIESGKENWILARKDLVHAKGKGAIQTYWVLTSRRTSSNQEIQAVDRPKFIKSTLSTGSTDNNSDDGSSNSGNGSVWGDEDLGGSISLIDLSRAGIQSQYDSLIDWLVELMTRQLKQIIAGRSEESTMCLDFSQTLVNPPNMPLVEATEHIELPKFDPKAAKLRASKNSFDVPEKVVVELRQYVRLIAAKYRDNPFHNFAHCGHVTMSASKLLSRIVHPETVNYHRSSVKAIASDLHDYTYGITSDSLTQFAILLCCVVHDVDHTGVSNAQRGKECPDLAQKYKDRSVAEQNSIDIAWAMLMDPQFENLRNCIFATESELKRFRQLTVNLVLATDIFDREMKETRNMRWDRVFHSDWTKSVKDYGELRSLKAMIVIEHIIQAADVSHTMQHWHVYKKWNQRLFEEMYLAYLDGRSPKDPSEGWYSGELWFFDNYVIPLAKKLEECKVFGVGSDECLNYALENRKEWEIKGKEVVKEMLEKCKKSGKSSMNSSAVLASQEDEIVFELGTPVVNEKQSLNPVTVSPILADTSPSLKTSNTNGLHTIDSIFPKFGGPNLDSDYESESSSTESTSEPPVDSYLTEMIESDCANKVCEEIAVDVKNSS